MSIRHRSLAALGFVFAATLTGAIAVLAALAPDAMAATESSAAIDPSVMRWGFVSAAAAVGLSSLAAGYAVAMVGSAGVGALAEKPELLGRVLVLVGLAEGIAIYGLIVAILILNGILA